MSGRRKERHRCIRLFPSRLVRLICHIYSLCPSIQSLRARSNSSNSNFELFEFSIVSQRASAESTSNASSSCRARSQIEFEIEQMSNAYVVEN